MTDYEDKIIKLTVIVLLSSITLNYSKIEMIGNTKDMPRLNKGDFILTNIPVDLPEAIPFFTILIQVVYYISIVIDNTGYCRFSCQEFGWTKRFYNIIFIILK